MLKGIKLISVFISLLVIMSAIASANTVVAGKVIYDSDYNNFIANETVSVSCDSSTLTTTSLSDGTYAVVFEDNFCDNINSSPANSENKATKVAVAISTESSTSSSGSGGGGSSGSFSGYFLCGNKKCDSGETKTTCPKDCNQTSNIVILNETKPEEKIKVTSESKPATGLSGITGAVIGFAKTKQGVGIIIALVIILAGIFVMTSRKSAKTEIK